MREYFYNVFPGQLRSLDFQRPNRVLQEHLDRWTMFFGGGPEWERVRDDLTHVPDDDRPRFILALFMIVVTDQAIYTYYRDLYQRWRDRTAFPKFGWSGFGPHNENLMQILWTPERERAVEAEELIRLLPDFVSFWTQETASLFQREYPEIPIADYFSRIRGDRDWRATNQGRVSPELKRLLEEMPQPFGSANAG